MPTYTPLRRKIVHSLNNAGSPYSWQPPQGATEVSVLMVGGGGGNEVDGGGGGGIIETTFKPTNGTTYTLTVGAGGVGTAAGGDTKFNDGSNDIFNAKGGAGGFIGGGAGGVPAIDITIVQDLVSFNPTTGGVGGTGGSAGGNTKFATGGAPGSGNDGGGASLNIGGGGDAATAGGGGGWAAGQAGTAGGDGGEGRIVLSYRLGSGIDDNVPA